MTLETMRPDPSWDATAHAATVETFRDLRDTVDIRIWCGDWCKDCRATLPSFAAALDAAGYDLDDVAQYPVEKTADGSKVGPLVDEYDISKIPTIVIERDGETVARFVETEPLPPAEYLAEKLCGLQQRP